MVHRVSTFHDAARRARRLTHWYPAAWRERYGAEFEVLLESEIEDTTHSLKRFASIAWGGCRARVAYGGLVDDVLEPTQQRRAGSVLLLVSSLAFLTFGVVSWSKFQFPGNFQFTSLPGGSRVAGVANLVMSWAFAGLFVVAAAAVVPLWFHGVRQALGQRTRRLVAGLCLLPASIALLVWSLLRFDVTMRHLYDPHSPGNANLHPPLLIFQAFVLVRTSLAHPTLFIHDRPDVRTMTVWAFLQTLAVIGLVLGAATLRRRVDFSPRALVYESCLSRLTLLFMAAVCASTVVAMVALSSLRPNGIYGNEHLAEGSVTIMTLALLVSCLAAWRTRQVQDRRGRVSASR